MLNAFSYGCFQIYQNKRTEIMGLYFIGTIVSIKSMLKISDVGLFCKIWKQPNEKVLNIFSVPKLTKPYLSKSNFH